MSKEKEESGIGIADLKGVELFEPVQVKPKRRSVYESKAPEVIVASLLGAPEPPHAAPGLPSPPLPRGSVESARALKPHAHIDGAGPPQPSAKLASPWVSIQTGLVKRKPHQGHCESFSALSAVVRRDGTVGLHHFATLRRMGDGDLGVVDLVALKSDTTKMYAMKIIDKKDIEERNKAARVHTEVHILQRVDHPFVATLHAVLSSPSHLYLVMESCGGGDLYSLMDAQPGNRLTEAATRFYAAEVLIALQYLHLQGFAYRDLKPENVLIRCDGHLVLTDFDLSYTQGEVRPRVVMAQRTLAHLASKKRRKRRNRQDESTTVPIIVAEPTMRAESLVGTEEYIAPEIISIGAYSSCVDWWSLGILMYEMLFGRTPFRGNSRDATFDNILSSALVFPSDVPVTRECQEVIQQLLTRNPAKRLGTQGGAEDIKHHPFFRSIPWALIREQRPPFVPRPGMQAQPWGEGEAGGD